MASEGQQGVAEGGRSTLRQSPGLDAEKGDQAQTTAGLVAELGGSAGARCTQRPYPLTLGLHLLVPRKARSDAWVERTGLRRRKRPFTFGGNLLLQSVSSCLGGKLVSACF